MSSRAAEVRCVLLEANCFMYCWRLGGGLDVRPLSPPMPNRLAKEGDESLKLLPAVKVAEEGWWTRAGDGLLSAESTSLSSLTLCNR